MLQSLACAGYARVRAVSHHHLHNGQGLTVSWKMVFGGERHRDRAEQAEALSPGALRYEADLHLAGGQMTTSWLPAARHVPSLHQSLAVTTAKYKSDNYF